ncbi:unnamed protein product [Paramecium sonneborni]|uniref:Uncharacterized protein n=1 Tax=Paramecium sonneborni TaxID=65129 RepID=A0A8S1Q782_9CILI|nr:unnamed protein product [Paramecium sonneborni]
MNLTRTEKEFMCIEHNEPALFIDISQKSSNLRNRCLQCVGKEMSQWIDIHEAGKHFESIKSVVWNERLAIHLNNLDILQQLKEQLKQLKIKSNQSLDKSILNIDQQIQFIQVGMEKENRQINELKTSDIDQDGYQQSSQLISFIDYREIQSMNREQFKRLKIDQNLIQLEESIMQIQQCQKSSIEDVFETFSDKMYHSSNVSISTWHCESHNNQAVFIDLNEQATVPNRLACIDCVPQYPIQYTKLDHLNQLWRRFIEQNLKYSELLQINISNKTQKSISKYSVFKEIINELIIQQSQEISQCISSESQIIQNMIKKTQNWFQLTQLEIIEITNVLSEKNKYEIIKESIFNEFKDKLDLLNQTITNSLKQFQDKLFPAFQQIQEQILQEIIIENQDLLNRSMNYRQPFFESLIELNQLNTQKKPFRYQIINSINDERIETFAFNEDYSLLVTGYFDSNKINVYEFNQGQINQIQELRDHDECIYCLKFFRQQLQFLSGSYDKSIILWAQNDNNFWYSKYRLRGHLEGVYCLLINNNEDQIISCSADKSIKFWNQENQWQCNQTLSLHSNSITSISINQSNQYLISCARDDNLIYIYQQQDNNKLWIKFQEINIDQWGMRVCFIDNYTFAFQPMNKVKMYIFEQNNQNNLFIKTREVKVEAGNNCYYHFPLNYIESKQILVNRNSSKINFIRKQSNGSYETELVIDYEANRIFGAITNDGQYLVTWDDVSKQFQIRKYIE